MANLDVSLAMVEDLLNKLTDEEINQIIKDVKKLGIGGPTYDEYLEQFEIRDTLNVGGVICNIDSIDHASYLNDYITVYLKNGIQIEMPIMDKLVAHKIVDELEFHEIFVQKYIGD